MKPPMFSRFSCTICEVKFGVFTMHIKQVIIKGFKSYGEQFAIEPFSPQINCVVSGKQRNKRKGKSCRSNGFGSRNRLETSPFKLHTFTGMGLAIGDFSSNLHLSFESFEQPQWRIYFMLKNILSFPMYEDTRCCLPYLVKKASEATTNNDSVLSTATTIGRDLFPKIKSLCSIWEGSDLIPLFEKRTNEKRVPVLRRMRNGSCSEHNTMNLNLTRFSTLMYMKTCGQ